MTSSSVRSRAGTIAATCANGSTEQFTGADSQFLKFHGVYQQDDRDLRVGGRKYIMMIRGRIPDERSNPLNRLLIALYRPLLEWVLRFPGLTLLAALLIGLNPLVFVYGSLSQPYGMCLFACAAAFRFSVRAVERRGPLLAVGAGLFAGIAAGSSLLASAAAPVLLLWMWVNNREGGRTTKSAAFISAGAIPFAP